MGLGGKQCADVNYEDAVNTYDRVLALKPNHSEAMDGKITALLGLAIQKYEAGGMRARWRFMMRCLP